MKILLATDGSTHAQTAVEMAKRLLPSREDFITVLSVVDLKGLPPMGAWVELVSSQRLHAYEEIRTQEIQAAQRCVDIAAQQLREAGWQVETMTRCGHPAEAILHAANETHADVIMVGSRGLGIFKGWLLGSVSQAVVHAAPCSVWVVRTAPDAESSPCFRVLLATDGSDDAAAAVEALQQFNFGERSEVAVLTVITGLIFNSAEDSQAARALVNDVAESLRPSFGRVMTFVREGAPADEIIEAAQQWKANLIVVGSKGLSGIKALLIGSVSHKVATYAPCSALVVKKKQGFK